MSTDYAAFRKATARLASRGQGLARAIERYGFTNPESHRYAPELTVPLRNLLEAETAYLEAWWPIWAGKLGAEADAINRATTNVLAALQEEAPHE